MIEEQKINVLPLIFLPITMMRGLLFGQRGKKVTNNQPYDYYDDENVLFANSISSINAISVINVIGFLIVRQDF